MVSVLCLGLGARTVPPDRGIRGLRFWNLGTVTPSGCPFLTSDRGQDSKPCIKTSWVRMSGKQNYVARKCHMIPLEWVTRRVATGSFLRRHAGVTEGYTFTPPKLETFFKDDANHDPQWSEEQVLENKLKVGERVIGRLEYDIMARTTVAVFEVLERAWAALDCALIDMKIEFGVDAETGECFGIM
ncbi:Multifunctional protein ADE2 [Portunus trituberculatus]|uniref:Multifunctional protein ADE2 n=1 Tax=Portunus trituberculatus TaxID=210409 RepID=A0A5B7FFJ8_PORTR|nr:Multifunctional protein ADE2 [Portunus trituberculatus]